MDDARAGGVPADREGGAVLIYFQIFCTSVVDLATGTRAGLL